MCSARAREKCVHRFVMRTADENAQIILVSYDRKDSNGSEILCIEGTSIHLLRLDATQSGSLRGQ